MTRTEERPSIGIRSDLLGPTTVHSNHPGSGMLEVSGLPALEALRRQAGQQNPFLGSLSPHPALSLTTSKRPSQPPTPQSSTSGGDPSSAWSFEEQFKQVGHHQNSDSSSMITRFGHDYRYIKYLPGQFHRISLYKIAPDIW